MVAQFGRELTAGIQPVGQQWWDCSGYEEAWLARPAFADFADVYRNGELPSNGLWTISDPPSEVHGALPGAWDFGPGPTSRWLLPVRPEGRVFEITEPLDWVRLVERYPRPAPGPHYGSELRGPNQRPSEIDALLAVPLQHAALGSPGVHVLPDWAAVATDYDGVHLCWAGFITTEGFVSEFGDGAVTMLRYWGSERTLWLADVFGEPVPLPAPAFRRFDGNRGADASSDEQRRRRDVEMLTARLGRREKAPGNED